MERFFESYTKEFPNNWFGNSFQTVDKTLSAVFFICPTGHSSLFWGQAGSRIATLSLLGLPSLADPLE
ncbi:hypothetical protein, partial [Exiguobacterium sp.]|uniref:hypothetical protein n=1 Tax=Exiguobacterium sp. TaxID=44751 RepID=UPI00263A8407